MFNYKNKVKQMFQRTKKIVHVTFLMSNERFFLFHAYHRPTSIVVISPRQAAFHTPP